MVTQRPNPLRDPQDRRLPRIAGPCGMVLFGVTGDLSRKKVMPAIYDLANRGLLPPGFSLTGFARRDWADQDFADIVHDSVKQHARTEFREETWKQLAEGFRFVPGDFDDDVAFDRLRRTIEELDEVRGTDGNHAFYLAIPPSFFGIVADQLKEHGLAQADGDAWRRVVIEKPFGHDLESARELNAALTTVFPSDDDLPDRPLPRQGDRPEHPGDAVRQRDVRAAVERQLRRPRADHDGRGRRHRGPGRLLRRHRRGPRRDPEPPAPADGAGRDGGAHVVRRGLPCATRSRSCSPASASPSRLDLTTARGQYAAGWSGGRKVRGFLEEDGVRKTSQTETFAAVTLHVDNRRWAGVPFYLRTGKRLGRRVTEVAVVFKRSPHQPFSATAVEELTQNAFVIRVQPDEGVTLRFGSKVPGAGMEIRDVNMDFVYGGIVHRVLAGGLRAADPRRTARRPAAVPAARGGRAVLADPRPDPRLLGAQGEAGALPLGHLGSRVGATKMLARDGRSWRRP